MWKINKDADAQLSSETGQYEQKAQDLLSQIQDLEVELEKRNKNLDEFRAELDSVSAERDQLLEKNNGYELEKLGLKEEKTSVVKERDLLLKVIERQKFQHELLRDEVSSYQQRLENAVSAKCDAEKRVYGIKSQKAALDLKEHFMEQERVRLNNQIQTLTADLNRNILALQNFKRHYIIQNKQLEARLAQKTEALKVSQAQCCQYQRTIDRDTQRFHDVSAELSSTKEKANKVMISYKNELDAKTELAALYKNSWEDKETQQNELIDYIANLKRMVEEQRQQYGDLKTELKSTVLKHEQVLEEREKVIEEQKTKASLLRIENRALKRMGAKAMKQYGDLETEFKATVLKHEQVFEERDKDIEEQKTEVSLLRIENHALKDTVNRLFQGEKYSADTVRALCAQRRPFQEEENHFRNTTLELKRKAESAIEAKEEDNIDYNVSDKPQKHSKRLRTTETTMLDVTESVVNVEYQISTSSQPDQEDGGYEYVFEIVEDMGE